MPRQKKKSNGIATNTNINSDLSFDECRYVFPRGSIKDMEEKLKAKLKEYENRKPRKSGTKLAR